MCVYLLRRNFTEAVEVFYVLKRIKPIKLAKLYLKAYIFFIGILLLSSQEADQEQFLEQLSRKNKTNMS